MQLGDTIKIVAPGDASIRALAPPGRVICKWRDGWRLRETWGEVPDAGEVVEFTYIANDREDFRTILAIAAVAAAIIPGLQGFAPYLAAAAFAYNLILPPTQPDQGDPAKSLFQASLSGNLARLDQPIWKTFGIDRITPPFAAMPYVEFRDDDGDNVNNEQYFFAVLAVGYGPYDLLADFLGKTPVNHYQDVIVHQMLAPGVQPSIALANVFSSSDIAAFELDSRVSVGSYVACPPGKTVDFIGVDIMAPQGLGWVNGEGDLADVTVTWTVQARRINDAGAPIGPFDTVAGGLETRTMQTNTPQRWSGKYPISPAGRVEVRVFRTNDAHQDATARDTISWVGLRGYSSEPATLNPNVTHYEIVLRASKQLSQANQTDINLIVHGRERTWTPGLGWNCAIGDWASYLPNRNPAWALASVWSDPNYGEGLPDERIDLAGLYQLSLIWAARQDRCDLTLAQTSDAWSVGQTIARTGRARMFRRYGVRTLRRDEIATIGETAFSARMCRAGTKMSVSEKRPQSSDPDGIIVQYRSNVTWDTAFIECPSPGVVSMVRPVFRSYSGVQGFTHAKREGLYDAADMAKRQRTVKFETEAQGILTSFLAPVKWQPQIRGYGQTGDVAFWDSLTKVMGLTEPVDFTVGPLFITLVKDDGTITDPISVSPGATAYDVVLASDPGFSIVVNSAIRDRPVYLLGTVSGDEIVKVASIQPSRGQNGAPYFSVTAVVDDQTVHQVDLTLLPGTGGEQDPVGVPGDYGSDTGGLEIIVLNGGAFTSGQPVAGGATTWALILRNDGTARIEYVDYPGGGFELIRQWSADVIEPSTAALYEVMLTPGNPYFDSYMTGDAIRVWLNLGTTRTFTLTGPDRTYVNLTVSIRRVSDSIVQTTASYLINLRQIDLAP